MLYFPGYQYTDKGVTHYPDYISSEISTNQSYKYGIYEGRMKFASGTGSWPAFWFFGGSGADDPQYNSGYASEIDFAELNWRYTSSSTDHVFHWWTPNGQQESIFNGEHNTNVNWSGWHTFKVIYRPYDVKFYIDGIGSWQRSRFYYLVPIAGTWFPIDKFIEQINAGDSYPEWEWFPKHAGAIILSQQVSNHVNNPIVQPQTTLFDWVSYREFFDTPEITVPELVCSNSSETATLDVDERASNITWTLSPSNMFTTTSGSGSTANIVTSYSANGTGAITYSFEMPSGETFTKSKAFWVGTPVITGLDGPTYVPTNVDTRYYPLYEYQYDSPTNFEWNVSPYEDVTYNSYGWSTLVNFYNPDYYRIIYRGLNTCGWGDWYMSDFYLRL